MKHKVEVFEYGIGAPGEFKAEFWVNGKGPYKGSTFPDTIDKYPTIVSGSFVFKVVNYKGYKSLLLEKGEDIPITRLRNPNKQSSAKQGKANGIFVHRGYRNAYGTMPAKKGSKGCLTLRHSKPWTDWNNFIMQFNYGDTGTITIWRAIDDVV